MLTNIFVAVEDFFDQFYIPKINAFDIIEMLIIIFCLYYILKHIHNTRAWIFIKGIFVFFAIYVIAYLCGFNAIKVIFEKTTFFLSIASILILQPELRRFFESLGVKRMNFFISKIKRPNTIHTEERISTYTAQEISEACRVMAIAKTGALIVIENNIPLQEYIDSGILVDAVVTNQLLINTFEHNTPLHDGAVIIQKDRLVGATCYLPLSNNDEINKAYGTRHRAAIGMAEATDALIIIVSEETGHISVAKDGELKEHLSSEELLRILYDFQKTDDKKKKSLLKRIFRNAGLKGLSTIVGIFAWFLLINAYNPLTNLQVSNIPITVTNDSIISSAGQSYKLNDNFSGTIIIRDKRNIIESIDINNIKVIADMNNLSSINTVSLKVSIPNAPNANIKFEDGGTAKVEFEDIISKEFNLETVTSGNAMSGYYVGNVKSNVSSITISGPRSQINMIKKVVLPVDISGVSAGFNSSIIPVIYDVNDKIMDKLTISPSTVYVSGTVYKTKTVDLNIMIDSDNSLAYSISDFTYEPQKVKIAATEEVLSNTDTLTLTIPVKIDESKISNGKYITDVNLADYIDSSIMLVKKDTTMTLTLDIDTYIKKEMVLYPNDITYSNLDNKYIISPLFEKVTFYIWVPEDWAETITIQDIDPKVDCSHIKIGVSVIDITFVSDLIKTEETVSAQFSIELNK